MEPTSNRTTSVTNPVRSLVYDNAGNTLSDSAADGSGYTATYNLRGQLATLSKGGVTTTYSYDADGRRVRKVSSTGPASTVVFVYDLQGQLLGEYDRNGAALREYVWLENTPVAMFTPDPANPGGAPLVYYLHTDHLEAPRIVVDRNNQVRWRWLAEPFGTTAAETNPGGLGVFTQNLRFPGQYADQESGLFYNYHRYYAPDGGVYRQSDPIGLAGGSPSTYTYGDGNPLLRIDPDGRNAAWAVYRSWRFGQMIGTELYPIIEPGLTPLIDRLLLPDLMLTASNNDDSLKDTRSGTKIEFCPAKPPSKDPCKGLRKQLLEHEEKLQKYTDDPIAYDNQARLIVALLRNDVVQVNLVYQGRLKELRDQIERWKREIRKCEEKNGI